MNNKKFKIDYILLIILVLGLGLRLEVMISEGSSLFLYSDDLGYIESSINFNKSGYLTYADRLNQTLFIMPGMIILMSPIFKIFGHGELGLTILKLLFILISILTIYGVNTCSNKIFKNKLAGYMSSFFIATHISHIYLSNLFLTENIALFLIVFLTNKMLDFCDNRTNKNFIELIIWYLLCIMIKPTFGIYPIAFLPLMLYKKIPIKELILRGLYAGLILIMVLTPWTIRNYIITTGDIVPLTGNQGDAKLLGTFYGKGIPAGNYPDYVQESSLIVNQQRIDGEVIGYNHYFYTKARGILANERISEWKETGGYYKTILWDNPIFLMKNQFLPSQYIIFEYKNSILEKTFDISENINIIFDYFLKLSFVCILGILLQIKTKKEVFFKCISMTLGYIIILYINASYVPLTRYGIQNIILVTILAGQGVSYIVQFILNIFKKQGTKNTYENINNNTML